MEVPDFILIAEYTCGKCAAGAPTCTLRFHSWKTKRGHLYYQLLLPRRYSRADRGLDRCQLRHYLGHHLMLQR